MSQYGISDSASYSRISTAELNSLVRQIVTENNALGEVSVRSRLGYYGFKVHRPRVRAAIQATVGAIVQPKKIKRRVYYVRSPLAVIHVDGNHKLVRCVHYIIILYSNYLFIKYIMFMKMEIHHSRSSGWILTFDILHEGIK